MAAHNESRPSIEAATGAATTRTGSRPFTEDPIIDDDALMADEGEREAIPPPPSEGRVAASVSSSDTTEILETLTSLTDTVEVGESKDAIVDTVKSFARSLKRRVARLGGVAGPNEVEVRTERTDVATSRFSWPARTSLSPSLDAYRPDRDVVAPISVRPNAMELLWVCGDCGQHYPRARECPEFCSACGAPKQHFFAPIED